MQRSKAFLCHESLSRPKTPTRNSLEHNGDSMSTRADVEMESKRTVELNKPYLG